MRASHRRRRNNVTIRRRDSLRFIDKVTPPFTARARTRTRTRTHTRHARISTRESATHTQRDVRSFRARPAFGSHSRDPRSSIPKVRRHDSRSSIDELSKRRHFYDGALRVHRLERTFESRGHRSPTAAAVASRIIATTGAPQLRTRLAASRQIAAALRAMRVHLDAAILPENAEAPRAS